MKDRLRILIVDDESSLRFGISQALTEHAVITEASTGEEALEKIKNSTYDIVVTDLRMPGLGGLELIRICKKISPVCFIVSSGSVDDEIRNELLSLGVIDILEKPFSKNRLLNAIAIWRSAQKSAAAG